MFGGDGCRSTMVGDMVLLSNGGKYKVDPVDGLKLNNKKGEKIVLQSKLY